MNEETFRSCWTYLELPENVKKFMSFPLYDNLVELGFIGPIGHSTCETELMYNIRLERNRLQNECVCKLNDTLKFKSSDIIKLRKEIVIEYKYKIYNLYKENNKLDLL